jgi:hypothetical protein
MLGAVVLEKEPRTRSLKADEDLLLLLEPGVIIAMAEGKIPESLTMEGVSESLLGLLS